jgi:hypothetical protein
MTAIYNNKAICVKEYYKLNKKHWYWIDDDRNKIPYGPWWKMWCPLHKTIHQRIRSRATKRAGLVTKLGPLKLAKRPAV